MPSWLRSRLPYLALAGVTIGAGLLVHRGGHALSPTVRDMLGDALWAVMVFWWAGVAWPGARLRTRALGAMLFTWAVELSQLHHSPGLDAIRRTTLGHLVLGSDFDSRDLVAYSLGVGAASLIDWAARRLASSRSTFPT